MDVVNATSGARTSATFMSITYIQQQTAISHVMWRTFVEQTCFHFAPRKLSSDGPIKCKDPHGDNLVISGCTKDCPVQRMRTSLYSILNPGKNPISKQTTWSHQLMMWCCPRKNHLFIQTLSWSQLVKVLIHAILKSLQPSDAIWRDRQHGSESTLAQVMACCLTAPSHHLNLFWLITSKVLWHSSESNFIRDTLSHLSL